jgi:TRAP-type C4-dicarboxylate transport system permease large subunit
MGGIYTGWATPTEAGAVGAFVVLCLAASTGKFKNTLNILWESLLDTVKSSGMLLFILISAMLLSRLLVLSGSTGKISSIILGLNLSQFSIFLIVTLLYLFLGCFVGGIGMLVLTLPIIYPLMMKLGFDGLWFGIICVKYVEMAVITPPMGVNLYAVKSIADVDIMDIIKGALPFLSMDILTILIFYFFPQIITFLPSLIM